VGLASRFFFMPGAHCDCIVDDLRRFNPNEAPIDVVRLPPGCRRYGPARRMATGHLEGHSIALAILSVVARGRGQGARWNPGCGGVQLVFGLGRL
jgi:hypothetical protein